MLHIALFPIGDKGCSLWFPIRARETLGYQEKPPVYTVHDEKYLHHPPSAASTASLTAIGDLFFFFQILRTFLLNSECLLLVPILEAGYCQPSRLPKKKEDW
jgi:hypothetical protein